MEGRIPGLPILHLWHMGEQRLVARVRQHVKGLRHSNFLNSRDLLWRNCPESWTRMVGQEWRN